MNVNTPFLGKKKVMGNGFPFTHLADTFLQIKSCLISWMSVLFLQDLVSGWSLIPSDGFLLSPLKEW